MKTSTLYRCSECSYQSSKWVGRCPQCDAWNSFVQDEAPAPTTFFQKKIKAHSRTPENFGGLLQNLKKELRETIGIPEIDRVLGEGLVTGSLTLLTGEPGIGKSTLTIQIADALSQKAKRVLYISGEESEAQVALRGKRLGLDLKNLQLLSENNLETILATAAEQTTDFLIIDSIQVMHSQQIPGGPGSVSQVRLCTEGILEFAKPRGLSVLLIGHVTKDGTLAGPRVLEHLVDTVLYLEGSRTHDLRLLRGVKNRFGSVSEVGIFEMGEKGLKSVANPASFFTAHQGKEPPAGSALVMTLEGTRPLLIEVQALCNATVFGYPVRKTSGFDANRLQLLLAVIQKHLSTPLGNQDVYINVISGYKLDDPAADLAVCMAILSSYKKKAIPKELTLIGEVGLDGSIRLPKDIAKREKEIKKMGLTLLPPQLLSLQKMEQHCFPF